VKRSIRGRALFALCCVAIVQTALAAAAPGSKPSHREDGAIGRQRAVLTRTLLSASEATKRALPGTIAVESFSNGFSALVVTRNASLRDLQEQFPAIVTEPRHAVWEVRRTLFVARGATLSIGSPEVRELRLLSEPGRFASIIARSGNLEFRGAPGARLLVRSWDPAAGHPDRVLRDGRATVAVRQQGHLDASDATFARLGFFKGTVSGFALWASGKSHGTGTVRDSRFVNNYNGAFSFGARGMRWIHNRFEHNRVYGLDPHTGSSEFLVQGNYAARNGRHGIIFSRDCLRNVIRRNVSEHNNWHGIVIDDGQFGIGPSNFNVVVDNIARDNAKVGIQVDGSSHNLIRHNRITGGRQGIRILGSAFDNVVARNSIREASDFGLIVHAPSRRTLFARNLVADTPTGVRIHGAADATVTRNRILRVVSHAVKVDDAGRASATRVLIGQNRIHGSGTSPILVDTAREGTVRQRNNAIDWDYPFSHDVARALRTRVGPGLWILLLLTALGGPLVVAVLRVPYRRRSRI
jgi:parallel beta-helix repeat protein